MQPLLISTKKELQSDCRKSRKVKLTIYLNENRTLHRDLSLNGELAVVRDGSSIGCLCSDTRGTLITDMLPNCSSEYWCVWWFKVDRREELMFRAVKKIWWTVNPNRKPVRCTHFSLATTFALNWSPSLISHPWVLPCRHVVASPWLSDPSFIRCGGYSSLDIFNFVPTCRCWHNLHDRFYITGTELLNHRLTLNFQVIYCALLGFRSDTGPTLMSSILSWSLAFCHVGQISPITRSGG